MTLRITPKTKRSESGSALVETAFALPIFLLLLAAIVYAGWIALAQTIIDRGAQAGARVAGIPSSNDLRSYPSIDAVRKAVIAASPLLTPSSVSVVVTSGGRNAPMRVHVTYDVPNPVHELTAPLALFGFAPAPATITLSGDAYVRSE